MKPLHNPLIEIDAVRAFIMKDIVRNGETELPEDQDLLMSGLVDSLGVMRLVGFIEETSGITIPAEDVLLENFGSLSQINAY
ncbi:MAG: acyl carrier protein, partial [Pseudomonadota bacterium]